MIALCPTPRKLAFTSRRAAYREIKRCRKRHGSRLNEYFCPLGHHWHLTSQKRTLQSQLASMIWEIACGECDDC